MFTENCEGPPLLPTPPQRERDGVLASRGCEGVRLARALWSAIPSCASPSGISQMPACPAPVECGENSAAHPPPPAPRQAARPTGPDSPEALFWWGWLSTEGPSQTHVLFQRAMFWVRWLWRSSSGVSSKKSGPEALRGSVDIVRWQRGVGWALSEQYLKVRWQGLLSFKPGHLAWNLCQGNWPKPELSRQTGPCGHLP